MSKAATVVHLDPEVRAQLERWVRSSTTEQRLALRARIVLSAAAGNPTSAIADQLHIRPATVSRWRMRFAASGLAGLQDSPRPGAKAIYDQETVQRILAKLDEKPPDGHATWTGGLVAEALSDVSRHFVWRVLRQQGIALQRRRSWCISTDPQFAQKAADIVALYLNPPENAVVIAVDEKPAIQALERAQGYLKLPGGKAVTGFNHEYRRHGTTTLFAALQVATGMVTAGHYPRRRRAEFLDFMNRVVAEHPDEEIHVVLDNLNTHKPKNDRWLTRHKNVTFHYTPTHASWLNQVECWFSILTRRALRGASFQSTKQLRTSIDAFIESYNETAAPFEWTKQIVHPVQLKSSYAELRK
jgi:transposase